MLVRSVLVKESENSPVGALLVRRRLFEPVAREVEGGVDWSVALEVEAAGGELEELVALVVEGCAGGEAVALEVEEEGVKGTHSGGAGGAGAALPKDSGVATTTNEHEVII